jgi:enoyl-CoA hydratase
VTTVMKSVRRRSEPGVVVLSLNAEPANALDASGLEELRRALHRLRSSRDGIVLTGSGHVFCAGFDLQALAAAKEVQPTATADLLNGYTAVLIEMLTHPRPIIAALNGTAIAAGAILAYAADAVVAASGCRIGLPELSLGLPLQPLSFEILHASLGPALPRLLISGSPTLVRELPANGLAEVVADEQVVPQAIATARRLAASDATTFALAKQLIWRPVLRASAMSTVTEVEVRSVWERADVPEILRRIAASASSAGASR